MFERKRGTNGEEWLPVMGESLLSYCPKTNLPNIGFSFDLSIF